ncbi:ElyC/SanA/YdcF family protein [Longimicrobium terrae]|uniref:Uncharacterized SAM-binding protein YcdF (DUF218 family) n=1 Tax=Longimicrobium terrae TaxID=1639882 RepID=A0A841H3Z4_9BACT|nr:uncharacterized SAM-binding protein YcdF (DUF218 family) [Longimicrobium terrae]MBB6072698.1 uncharacterized SAM-binding protein YcdF (DUF218 family) [Longimicrobium terrae]NNC32428.1 DUF218 domain-containing protein [Longimicrobium terrae]
MSHPPDPDDTVAYGRDPVRPDPAPSDPVRPDPVRPGPVQPDGVSSGHARAAAKKERPVRKRAPLPVRIVRRLVQLCLFVVACWALTVAAIHVYGRRNEARKVDAIVVLGAAQYDGRPSPVLRARLDHAISLYKRGLAPRLIMTGGQAPGDTVSEAEVGRRYAARQGVPRRDILIENTGMTTVESMSSVASMMKTRQLKTAVMVSDPFHMLRLKLLARQFGIQGYTSPTRTSPISRNRGEERKHLIRESFSLPFALFEAVTGARTEREKL